MMECVDHHGINQDHVTAYMMGCAAAMCEPKYNKTIDHPEPPFLKGNESRAKWYSGFYHQQIYNNVGHILRKYNLEW